MSTPTIRISRRVLLGGTGVSLGALAIGGLLPGCDLSPPERYTQADIDTLAAQPMLLDSGYEDDRKRAHERIGTTINFILGTPYVFAQEGR